MFVSKHSAWWAACGAAFVGSLISNAAWADAAADQAKMQELERAMLAPQAAPIKKPKTRAIVFDTAAAPAPAASGAAAAVAATVAPAPMADCTKLPADLKTTAVDFAVQFKINSAEVAPSSEPLLQQVGKILALAPDRCVIVEGHTDVTGSATSNLELSKARAQSVVGFIAEKVGLQRDRLVPVGKGSSDTLKGVDPKDPKNRRVVFKVVG